MSGSRRRDTRYNGWQLYRRLLGYALPHRLAIYGAFIGYLIFAAMTPAAAWWLGLTVDAISGENYSDMRVLIPLLCVGIVLLRGAGGFLGSYSLAVIANHVVHKLRCDVVERMIRLPAAWFDRATAGKLVSKLSYDVGQVTGAASNAVVVIIREGFTVVGLMAYLMWIDWQLSLTFLIIAPFVGQVVNVATRRFRRYATRMQDSMGDLTQITTEAVKGHRVVRIFNAGRFVSGKLRVASERNRRQNMKMSLTRSASTPLIQIMVSLALALLVWLAMSPGFFAGKSAGDFVAFLSTAGLLAKPIRQLTQINSVIQRGIAAAGSLFTLLDEPAEVDTGSRTVERALGRIAFEGVSFDYGDGARVLQDISFVAEPGHTVALVGKSGSGKSSLVGLIPRYYDVQQGRITLDGVPLGDYKLENLRDQISLVSQQVELFSGSIAENIAYGDEELDKAKIEEAAYNAHAMEFIGRLPQGLDTQAGDDAGLLSGGQRQRIAIARALLKDAPVLILDEATSALDSESEQHIRAALDTLMAGRTTFVIAHRLSTVENADMILVMDEGRIVESGTHAELLRLNGYYARLHSIQFSENSTASTP